jgi:polar amino acid transport system substrate-binding protein
MKKALLPISIVAVIVFGIVGTQLLCTHMDRGIFQRMYSSLATGSLVVEPYMLENKEQCEFILNEMELYSRKDIPLVELESELGLELPTIRIWLFKLGYKSFRAGEDQKALLISKYIDELKLFTKQDFGENASKWRNYLRTMEAPNQEKTIVLATANYEPIIGEALPEGGVFTALSREAFRRAGYKLDIEYLPWKRSQEEAKDGNYDGILGAMLTPEREPFFTSTEALMSFKHLLFSRSEELITYTVLSELKPYTIGTVQGSASEETLKAAGLTIESVTKYEQNLKKLMLKRIDLMVGDSFLILDLLKKYPEYKGKIRQVSPPIKVSSLQNLLSKTHPEPHSVVTDFNKGLSEMRADGTFDAILERFGFSELW